MLLISGHEYYLKRKNKTTTNWSCSKYQNHKCRATAITDGENFIETRGEHNHDICHSASPTNQRKLSSHGTTSAQSTARSLTSLPSIRSFEILEFSKQFIKFDSGQNDHERIVLFGDPEMLRVHEKSNFWLADGTFKVTLKMFYQFYSIHVSLSGIAPACISAFLSNKTEKTYHHLLEALRILALDSRPENILLDFEQAAAIQAFQKNFSVSKLSVCFFQLSKSFMRKIAELGLKNDYKTNHEFALALKMLLALAFEKEEENGNSYS